MEPMVELELPLSQVKAIKEWGQRFMSDVPEAFDEGQTDASAYEAIASAISEALGTDS